MNQFPDVVVADGADARDAGRRGLPVTLSPDRRLLLYYALTSLLFGPAFPVAFIVLYFRYETLRYDVEEEGITMRWGILFRREVSLTYARIQDIHLSSNVFERWLGLAKIQLQTASGSAGAEMSIEGLLEFAVLRDFLYSRMRGAHDRTSQAVQQAGGAQPESTSATVAGALREVAAEVRSLRLALASKNGLENGNV